MIKKINNIELHRLAVLRSGLKLETMGLKRRGRSCYAIVKDELKYKGTKQRVFDQLSDYILEMKGEGNA
jgi:hypothetical protein